MNNQQKPGLQDDHDPRELAQKQNDKKGDFKPAKQPSDLDKGTVQPDSDVTGGVGSQGGM